MANMANIKHFLSPVIIETFKKIGHRPGYHDKPFVVKNLLPSKIVEQILLMFKYRFTLVFLSIHLSSIFSSWAFICMVKSMFDQAGVL